MASQDIPKPKLSPFQQMINSFPTSPQFSLKHKLIPPKNSKEKAKRKVSYSPLAVAARHRNITLGRLSALKGTAIQLAKEMPDSYCRDRLFGLIRDIDHIHTMAKLAMDVKLNNLRESKSKV